MFSPDRTQDSHRIYVLKREIAEFRRAVHAVEGAHAAVRDGGYPFIHSDAGAFFRDIADHVVRVNETIETLDQLLSTAFEAHLARISVDQNEDMRKISAWVAIAAVEHPGRRRLRHELRLHARAEVAPRLPDGASG